MEHTISGVGVIDKASSILTAVEAASQAGDELGLGALVERTGMSRATAHRIAGALEVHGFLRRSGGGYVLGPRLLALGRAAMRAWPIADSAAPALRRLRDETGESAQLFVREGDERVCVASLESPHGLRTIVTTGARLPLDQGSGGSALQGRIGGRGFAESVGEREAGVASVSAPVADAAGAIVAAVSVSGPIERLSRRPGDLHGDAVVRAAASIATAAAAGPVD